jgi:calcineurin-like phosphoesterase family protein
MIYLTSDHHFDHINSTGGIITFCNRPFRDIPTMNREMINHWNSVVQDCDEVYYLGDLSFGSKKRVGYFVNQLKGKIYFIKGNHDKSQILNFLVNIGKIEWWEYNYEFDYEKDGVTYTFILSHYQHQPIKDNVISIFGHSHGNYTRFKGGIDVGVDNVGYDLISIDTIIEHYELLRH